MKVVINKCYGGFSLSRKAFLRLRELGHPLALKEPEHHHDSFCHDINRSDPLLVKVVEELGSEANGPYAKLKIVEIPDSTQYEISDYDGVERIEEAHSSWS